jgi:hypothetical protein
MKRITVKEGNKASNQLFWPRFLTSGMIKYRIKFTEESKYDLGNRDQEDWNKLTGASWGFFPFVKSFQMHHNSSRWGWRYNPKKDVFEVTPYYYINGVRFYYKRIAELKGNEYYDYCIMPFYNMTTYSITDSKGKLIYYCEVNEQKVNNYGGWIAPIRFGGNQFAPHVLSLLFKWL